jgi:N-acetyltransferase
VDKGSRRMKIATKLLDCVRDNFLYFQSLNSNQIAFSDPTDNGKQFATKYFKTNEFYIYFK